MRRTTKVDKMIAGFKRQCTVIKNHDAGLMGDYNTKEIDYKKLSRLLIHELKCIEELYEG